MRRVAALAVLLTTCLSLALAAVPATAEPGDPFPSRAQVDRAQARATEKARAVSAIKARMLLADQRLEQAALDAEQASETYNGARWALAQARQQYRRARSDALRARRVVASQRDRIGALVAQSYQDAGDLSSLNAMMGSDGPEGVLDQYVAFQGASTSLQADYQRFVAGDSLARVYEAKADEARSEQVRLARRARLARDRAVSAAEDAQTQAAVIAGEKRRLITELARAQHISVALARTRQTAIEEIARKRAEARARRASELAARIQALAQVRANARTKARPAEKVRAATPKPGKPRSPGRPAESAPAPSPQRSPDRPPDSSPDPSPDPAPRPAPQPAPAPSSSGGAQQAIRFAQAQLGEPYQWGAAGPDAWDCSGLTMKAWATAGRSLPHYSVAQYEVSTPISVSSLRAGDLVFWSSNGRPSGIHHVALYIGDGQILHAPRTGRPVAVDSMYYWVPPSFFGRV